MSNQRGDLYSCSDPNCGCEIEIKQPCAMVSMGAADSSEAPLSEQDILDDSSVTELPRRDFRSHDISMPGDSGSQGATGEGVFGTSGTGDRSATASGRYDQYTRTTSGPHELAGTSQPKRVVTNTLTCFCGREMSQVGSGNVRSRTASIG